MYENATCTSGFCHCRAFQQRRESHRIVRVGRVDVCYTSRANVHTFNRTYRRIWNTGDGQCLKTLAEGHDAIWCVTL
jgi:hypothetical protein